MELSCSTIIFIIIIFFFLFFFVDIFSKESFSYISGVGTLHFSAWDQKIKEILPEKISYTSGNGNPKKSYVSGKGNTPKNYYISENGTLLYFWK